jgi:hypothetical protein
VPVISKDLATVGYCCKVLNLNLVDYLAFYEVETGVCFHLSDEWDALASNRTDWPRGCVA